jgi:asparagine synthase (glutamine-hydrolysing)
MPGIAGMITRLPRQQAVAEVLRMVATLRHESGYITGTWCDEAAGVYIGWAARHNSFSDAMPLRNENGNTVLVFSGEDFPEPETRLRLKERGHAIGAYRPSYLVHLAEEDPRFPLGLNGRFHGLLSDREKGEATLFNDRYGMHRIYYHKSEHSFYFAAEAKAILTVRPELRSADPRGLAEFISCGCTMQNRTIFQNIHLLPPASSWRFLRGSLTRKETYFTPKEWEEQTQLGPETYYQQLHEVFARNLPRYFDETEKVGVSLTGGLDSRMIMAWHNAAPRTLPCYSFGGTYHDCQDVVIARRVARACGQLHQVITVGSEFLDQFPRYSERSVYLTDGCVEVKYASDLYANEIAAQIAPVRMTGNYGGEVLRGVRAFKYVEPLAGLFNPDLNVYLQSARKTYAGLSEGNALSFALFRQAPWHHYGLLSLEQSQLSLRSPYLDNDFVKTVYRAPFSSLTNDRISLRLIRDGNPALGRIRTDQGVAGTLPSFFASLQQRYLTFTAKAEYAYDYGMPQSVARVDHALSALHLERLFLGRHKFYHFRVWYRDALANYVREMLLDERTLSRPYLRRDAIEEMVDGHLRGNRNYTNSIHKVLTLEHMHRLFFD